MCERMHTNTARPLQQDKNRRKLKR